MSSSELWHKLIVLVLAAATCFAVPLAKADEGGLENFVGDWDVHVRTLRPKPSEVRYTETYEWVLDGKFLRGQTGRKPDGTRDIIFATYDEQSQGYPFWIFSSSGSYSYLAPGTWDARALIMEWRNPAEFDIVYRSRCHFPDRNNRHCTLLVKDWKGTVLSELEWSAVRRRE